MKDIYKILDEMDKNKEWKKKIDTANKKVTEAIIDARPVLIDIKSAIEAVPGMKESMILHSGPPLVWQDATALAKRAAINGALHEGLCKTPEEGNKMFEEGRIIYDSAHHHGCLGSLGGIYTASSQVFVMHNKTHGNYSFCHLHEGNRFDRLITAIYNDKVRENLLWIKNILGPGLGAAIRESGGIDWVAVISEALKSGDECHSRSHAGTAIFCRIIMPHLLKANISSDAKIQIAEFLDKNDQFACYIHIPAIKAIADAAHGVKYSTIVTAFSTSSRDFGLRVSGLGSKLPPYRWFTCPLPEKLVGGRVFEGYTLDDVVRIGGDSASIDSMGAGSSAMACAPGLGDYAGGMIKDMLRITKSFERITITKNPNWLLPILGFRGASTGIDIRKVIKYKIEPYLNGGLVYKDGGHIGAGMFLGPMEAFNLALRAMYESLKEEEKAG